MPYIGKSPNEVQRTRYYYTVSAGATSVSGSDDNSKSLIFSDGEFVDVSLNGVALVAGTDYNTTTANTIAGLSAMSANDVVEVVVYDVFSVFSGDISGDLDVGGNLSVSGTSTITTAALAVTGDYSSTTSGTSNLRLGVNAGNSIASGGNYNVVLGDEAGTALTTGDSNVLVGMVAGDALDVASDNVAVGQGALTADTKGSKSVAIGRQALTTQNFTSATDSHNTAVGYHAGFLVTTGTYNTFIGSAAGDATDDGAGNTAVGSDALSANCGNNNTAVGNGALQLCTGADNTGLGVVAGYSITSGSNNLMVGHDAGLTGSPGGSITTASNTLVLGDENIGACHIQTDWTVASDQRDKTDFTALDVGLDFVNALKPVTYKWDKRSKYGDKTADDYDLNNITTDGTHKEDWLDIGFKAQEVEALEKAAGYKISDKTNLTTSLTGDGKQYGIQYAKFVPILVKAIQELTALNTALTARVKTLEDA